MTPAEPGGVETVAGRAIGAASAQASTVEMLRLELAEEQQAIKDYATLPPDLAIRRERLSSYAGRTSG